MKSNQTLFKVVVISWMQCDVNSLAWIKSLKLTVDMVLVRSVSLTRGI